MKLNAKTLTNQVIWPAYLKPKDKNYPLKTGKFMSINKLENLILPLIIKPEKIKFFGESLPFEFVEPLTDNEIYLKKLAGFNLPNF